MGERFDAVVVGAGLSGLCAARRLRAAGQSVAIVEARERVGGRTLSQALGADTIDLGGQWIGPTQDRVARLASELGVATFPQFCDGAKVLAFAGGVKTYRGDIPSLPLLSLLELQTTIWRLDAMAKRVPVGAPWRTKDAEGLDAQTFASWMDRHVRTRGARETLGVATRAIFAVEPNELSFLHFLFYLRSGGGMMRLSQIRDGAQEKRFVGGAQQLSERLAEPLADAITMGSPVGAIEQDEGGVQVRAEKGVVRARRAILALAPAMIDRIDVSLPAMRDQLTQRMPMGSVIKCIAAYERPFWRERGLSGEAVCDEGPVRLAFDDSAHDGSQHALVAFVLGADARVWSERGAAARRDAVLGALSRFFGPDASRPTAYVDHDWTQERFSGGCYVGVMPPGVMTTSGPALRAPCGRLHWAGTETATTHNGYLDGAIEAGERAADEVIAASS